MPQEVDVEKLLREAQNTIAKQQELLMELTARPSRIATVASVIGKEVLLSNGYVVDQRAKVVVKVGDTVRLAQTGQIVETSPFVGYGGTGTVVRIMGSKYQIAVEQGMVTVPSTRVPVELGDEVLLDSNNLVILEKLVKPPSHAFTDDTGVGWGDIGGLAEAKAALRESVELPYTHAALYKHFGKKPVKGVLLHGLPGNGKTMLGKATATAIAAAHGKKPTPGAFIYIKGPELLSKWVGETEQMIRGLFEQARRHEREKGYPAVIFIDEADALLTARGNRTASGMEHTIVPQFLSEMDGLEESGAIVLLATNRADMLDPAIVRPGRIDRKVHVTPPDRAATVRIFAICFGKVPAVAGLHDYAAERLFSASYPLYQLRTSKADMTFHLFHVISGAMVAGVVEQASAAAIRRCIAGMMRTGITCEADVDTALAIVHNEHQSLNHELELHDWAERSGVQIKALQRIRAAAAGA